jgi:type IV pilus assembly protein PilC
VQTEKTAKLNKKDTFAFLTMPSVKEREYFLENLAYLLASGLDILHVFAAVKSESSSKHMAKYIQMLEESMDNGKPLWLALDETRLYKPHIISLIKLGEESGKLRDILKVIVERMQKERIFKSKLISAMLYPILVIVLGAVIGLVIVVFVLPQLVSVYEKLDVELPLITRMLISLGGFMQSYSTIVVPLFLLVTFVVNYVLFINKSTKHIGQHIFLRIPKIGSLIKEIELARMGYILGTLLRTGTPIEFAFHSLGETTSYQQYRKLYYYIEESIKYGESFKKLLLDYPGINKLLPFHVQQMIIVAEETANLSQTFYQIGETFEARNEISAKNLTTVLEPLLLVVVWIGVAFIAVAVILPIYSLIGGLDSAANPTSSSSSDTSTAVAAVSPSPTISVTPSRSITSTASPVPTIQKIDLSTSPTPINATSSPTAPKKTLTIQAAQTGFVNVRKDASASSQILTKALDKETFEYTEVKSGWYRVTLQDGTYGWISSTYVKLQK